MKNLLQHLFVSVINVTVLSGFVLITSGFSYNRSQITMEPDPPISDNESTTDSFVYLPVVMTQSNHETVFKVNVPYFNEEIKSNETAISWFGQVTPTDNYADVRLGYNDEELYIDVSIFDMRLWYDTTPSPDNLTEWDAVTVYLDLDGNVGDIPDTNSYKFVGQLNWWEARGDWQVAYQGSGSGWEFIPIPFTTSSGWRGNAPNDDVSDRGWRMKFHIPFASLGLASPPPQGNVWGIAIALHDRDDQPGTFIADKTWPEGMDANRPGTWGQLAFGIPEYTPPVATPSGEIFIRQGLNGAEVMDAHIGGHTVCGEDYAPSFFDGWGDANYAGYTQINVQNQGDVADWPCFSKYYITFPLDSMPADQSVISATLRMFLFGNSGQGWDPVPIPSLIQVMTVADPWDEKTITWNNAPLAVENIAQTWVYPVDTTPAWPGIPYDWDISQAVTNAYQRGEWCVYPYILPITLKIAASISTPATLMKLVGQA